MKKFLERWRELNPCIKKLWLIMRLSSLLILLTVFSSTASVYSQATKLTLKMENAKIAEVFDKIEQQSEFYFFYNRDYFNDQREVSVDFENKRVEEILQEIFEEENVEYEILDRNILIKIPKTSTSISQNSVQQQPAVSGTVTDESGEPLPGVTVVVKGTTQGTVTNADGEYSLNNIPEDATLVFSFVGMRTQEIPVGNQTNINVTMEQDFIGIDEVVAVGYGTMKKSDLTGAIASVKGDELVKMSTASPTEALQGRIAGVSVMRNSGLPGEGYKVRIRGVTSINNSEPLYVIDGIPAGNMDNINPNDIENIEVLKDASSTAIYGSRGASGVILVTTKSGKTGRAPTYNFNSFYSFNNMKQVEMTNGYENAMLLLEAHENDNVPLTGDVKAIFDNAIANKSEGVNAQDYILQEGHLQEYQFSMQGSYGGKNNQHLNYYLSGSYTDEKGTLIFTNFDRVTLLSKLHYSINKNIEFGYESRYTNSKNRGLTDLPWDNPLKWAVWSNPNEPVLNEDGSYGEMIVNQFHNNALQAARDPQHRNNKQVNLLNIGWMQLKFLNSLTFKSTFSYSNNFSHLKDFREKYFVNVNKNRPDNELTEERRESTNWNWSNILTFQKLFNDTHDVTIMAGHEASYGKYDGFGITAVEGVPDDEILRYLNNATSFSLPAVFVGQSGLESFFGRFIYSYKNKYILNGIIRTDGSYKFPEDNRWGTFPSVGAAWIASEEQFIKDLNVFDLLKFRINWGEVGNQASAAAYAYISSINQNQMYYAFDNETLFRGGIATDTPNPELQWETVRSSNIAVDMGFWDNRFTLSADFYNKDTEDMIIRVPVPQYTSNSEPYANVGDMRNNGLELSAEYRNSSNDWSYSVGGNITFNKNEVLSLGSKAFIDGGANNNTQPRNITRTEVGEEVAYFRGFEYGGIYKTQEQIDASGISNLNIGDAIFVDQNNDGVLDDEDMIKIGSPHPDFTFGLTGNVQYKNFDLSVNAVGSYGNDIFNAYSSRTLAAQGYPGLRKLALERYHPVNNPDGTIPRLTILDPNQNFFRLSSFHLEDGTYFKVKLIQLGYTFPSALVNRIKLSNLRVYVTAQNMITFTNYSGLDPEITQHRAGASNSILASGIDEMNIPVPRTMTFGLNISF